MHNLLLPFHQKRQLKRKNFTNFIKSNILNKSIKRWLFLFFVCLSPPGQLRTFTMSSIQFSAWLFEQVQKHCTSPIVSSRHEISLQLEYQNPEQKLVQRNSFFLYLIFLTFRISSQIDASTLKGKMLQPENGSKFLSTTKLKVNIVKGYTWKKKKRKRKIWGRGKKQRNKCAQLFKCICH